MGIKLCQIKNYLPLYRMAQCQAKNYAFSFPKFCFLKVICFNSFRDSFCTIKPNKLRGLKWLT